MNNNNRINEILQFWADVYENNPQLEFTYRYFYHQLIFNDVKPEDRQVNLSEQISKLNPRLKINPAIESYNCLHNSTFNNWIQMFSNSNNTDCFISDSWNYFCQFISRDRQARAATEHMKIYIPLDANHIEYGAKIIFDFLDQNSISHLSRIGQEIRFDDIVIRLIDPEDTDKLLNFVKSNSYLQEGLIKPNPFAFQKDGIAMAIDGDLSYNTIIATLLKTYMDCKRSTNSLNYVDVEDFYRYLRKLYKEQFIEHTNNTLSDALNWESYEEKNYRQVISLIIQVHDPTFNYDSYLRHYSMCANIPVLTEQEIRNCNNLLVEALQTMTSRFNHNGMFQVESFFESGRADLITNNNNLRNRMVNSTFRSTLRGILNQRKMSFKEYAQQLLKTHNIDLDDIITFDKTA